MVLFLGEQDVEELLTMKDAISVLEDTFREHGLDNVINHPRFRVRTGVSMLHYLAGAIPSMGVMGYKAYTSSRAGIKFRVFLHDIETGSLLSIMDGNYMGMIRTGAATGVATKYMARDDAEVVGIFGTGWQARGQLLASKEVRNIRLIKAYSRNQEKRKRFAVEMSSLLGIDVVPVDKPEEVIDGSHIIITATTASEPLFSGEVVREGMHINAIGGNFLYKREIDEVTVRKSSKVVVESREQSMIEAGELLSLVEKGRLHWDRLTELGEVVAGREKGRERPEEITLFKSLGIAIEDIAVAAHLYKLARERGIGREIPIPSL
ncbi:MAG: ornithine cyclodeaminase family protein [Candidatus Methanosuratincola sp.]